MRETVVCDQVRKRVPQSWSESAEVVKEGERVEDYVACPKALIEKAI